MPEYLTSKNPRYYYNTILVETVVLGRQRDGSPIEIQGCMKQHFIIFKPNEKYFCKGYFCHCTSCLHLDFENRANEDADVDIEDVSSEEELFDWEIDQTE